jgi:hypothetical protein
MHVENDRLIGRSFSFVALMSHFIGRFLRRELLVRIFNPNSHATVRFTIAGLSIPNAAPNLAAVGPRHGVRTPIDLKETSMTNNAKITLAAALIAAFAAPAIAQDIRIVNGGYQAGMTKVRNSRVPPNTQWYRTPQDPNAVFVGGTYAGSDPDPNIRAAIAREFSRRP